MDLTSSAPIYSWYSKVEATSDLQQGDIIFGCQIIQPKKEAEEINQTLDVEVSEYDVIIMSQSCDLVNDKIELVLVCPFHSLTELGNKYSEYKNPAMKDKLRQGHIIGFHLLNRLESNEINDYLVVDFKSVYAVPLNFLKQIIKKRENRIRLLPPYREHLSQAFARFFMRVGLPVDIPQFK